MSYLKHAEPAAAFIFKKIKKNSGINKNGLISKQKSKDVYTEFSYIYNYEKFTSDPLDGIRITNSYPM